MQEVVGEETVELRDYWHVLKKNWFLIGLLFILASGSAGIASFLMKKEYQATATLKLPASSGGSSLAALAGIPGASSDIATETQIVKTREIAEKVIRDLGLDKKEENRGKDWRRIVTSFQKSIKVSQERQTSLIKVTATGETPKEAKEIANAIALAYIDFSKRARQKLLADVISQMNVKVAQAERALEASRKALHEYEAKAGMPTAFASILLGGGLGVSGSSGGGGAPTGIPGIPEMVPQIIATLESRATDLELQLNVARKSLGEADPTVIRLKQQLEETRRKLAQEKERAIEKYNKQYKLSRLAADVLFNQQTYAMLLSKQEELRAQFILQNRPPELVEAAIEPIYPSKPRKKMNMMLGGILGIMMGVGVAFFAEYLNRSVRRPRDVEAIGLKVLGRIPAVRRRKGIPAGGEALISYHGPRSLLREAYRAIQVELESRGVRKVLVSSPGPREGKSTVAANLAISFARSGRRTLLIDADSRRAIQDELFGVGECDGLSEILLGKADWRSVLRDIGDGLFLITAGKSFVDPSSFLGSSGFPDLIKEVGSEFDFIVIDSPPVLVAAEAAAMSSSVDGVLLVVKMEETLQDAVLDSATQISDAGGKVLGVVLNWTALEDGYYGYYKGYYTKGEVDFAFGRGRWKTAAEVAALLLISFIFFGAIFFLWSREHMASGTMSFTPSPIRSEVREEGSEAEVPSGEHREEYLISAGAYKFRVGAESLAKTLREKGGYDVGIREIQGHEGETLYRVEIKGFSDIRKAQEEAERISRDFSIETRVIKAKGL